MTYYLVPKTTFLITKHIDCVIKEDPPNIIISNSLASYLYNLKEKIDMYEKEWDVYKKYTNPYEYIHSVIPYKKKCVSKHKPLSRSFFKMIEIVNTFNLNTFTRPIKCFHLAEGPGGFIEALLGLRNCKEDVYIGMTILDEINDSNIPAWKKSEYFLKTNENVFIEAGADNTGNILSVENFTYCKENYGNYMDFITGDGGFDFSFDFNNQEISISKLLFAQICYALVMQKKGGTFVLKMFDCFMEHSVDLLYILAAFYDKVYITKPQTSRYANSEKYIVCKDFLFDSSESYYPNLLKAFEKMMTMEESHQIHRFLTIPISYYFLIKLEEYNAIFGQQQLENIHYTLSLIENNYKQDKINMLVKANIQKCLQWCSKNKIESNVFIPVTNAFSSREPSTALMGSKQIEDLRTETPSLFFEESDALNMEFSPSILLEEISEEDQQLLV
jgi:23S rRNA U2552 (ribose-2'-O)-methylase RlmE/FtsJ